MPTVTAEAPAKVNLWLSVGPPGDDGYHAIATVFQALDLVDRVTVSPSEAGSGISIAVAGEGADQVPLGPDNLAWRAAELVAAEVGVDPDVRLEVDKRIPVAGGMAGGSADAAAALVACDAMWGAVLPRERLAELAALLGSDVPFSLAGGTAVGTGRGDRLSPVLARGRFHWVVAVSEGGLPTPEVYRTLDRMRGEEFAAPPSLSDEVARALAAGDAVALGRALGNDLQAAALRLRPGLGRLLAAGEDSGALGGLVSGSGPTCVFLARDAEHALDLAVRLSGAGVCRTVRTASGPCPGARLVD